MLDPNRYEQLPNEFHVIEHVWIPLSDGCRLSAKLWLPANTQSKPVPAVLEYIPYRRGDATALRDHLNHSFFASHCYASVRVDMRGTGNSDGLQMDEYWLQGTVQGHYESIGCAVYVVGGWADGSPNTVFRLLESLPAETPCKGLSGPWGHTYPHLGVPGPAIGFLPEALRWWDRWLKGIHNGIDTEPQFTGYLRTLVPPDARHAECPGRCLEMSA